MNKFEPGYIPELFLAFQLLHLTLRYQFIQGSGRSVIKSHSSNQHNKKPTDMNLLLMKVQIQMYSPSLSMMTGVNKTAMMSAPRLLAPGVRSVSL